MFTTSKIDQNSTHITIFEIIFSETLTSWFGLPFPHFSWTALRSSLLGLKTLVLVPSCQKTNKQTKKNNYAHFHNRFCCLLQAWIMLLQLENKKESNSTLTVFVFIHKNFIYRKAGKGNSSLSLSQTHQQWDISLMIITEFSPKN